ncbi:hypothetical protein LDG_5018 [Legionella drancourtii LLAP12]|uniref:Uncharacterized protein n=1 Tax=Legionella drancourtii LLAP12 TaxID=658187 RepID=G9EIL3_9GAMM|nr:hypothetical protein LDG_5018 [Legionella drancourtii LLAP12]
MKHSFLSLLPHDPKKECLNLHEVIEKLVTNKKIDLLATA